MTRRLVLIFALSAAVLAAFQWTNEKKNKPRDPNFRDVQGLVTLPDDTPAEGAVVHMKNLRTQKVVSFITQASGKYLFTGLSSKTDYELKADYKAFSSPARTLTIYDTRLDPIVNLKLEPRQAAKAEEAPADKKQ